MLYALTAIALLQLGLLYLLTRQHSSQLAGQERDARTERTDLLIRFERERQLLLNRIQMPEIAVGQTVENRDPATRGWVGYEDDDDLKRELEALDGDGG